MTNKDKKNSLTLLRYPGGKFYAIKLLRPFWEAVEHDEYREPFFGGGAVFWAKEKVKAIRLISCNTGKLENGFAQNLANKMHVPVKAPNDIIWAHSDGKLTIGPNAYTNTGKWKIFYPKKIKGGR